MFSPGETQLKLKVQEAWLRPQLVQRGLQDSNSMPLYLGHRLGSSPLSILSGLLMISFTFLAQWAPGGIRGWKPHIPVNLLPFECTSFRIKLVLWCSLREKRETNSDSWEIIEIRKTEFQYQRKVHYLNCPRDHYFSRFIIKIAIK